jgi:hypothetical protein
VLTVSVLLNRGDGSFELLGSYNGGGLFANSVTAADLDADGDPDLVVAHQDFGIAVLLSEGGRSFAPPVTYAPRWVRALWSLQT